jgi:glycosyltransferase involved in cell wall biosynthesis
MRILYLTDRLSLRGGADQHLRQVIAWAIDTGYQVTVAAAAVDRTAVPAGDLKIERVAGLGSRFRSSSGLDRISALMAEADLVHLQNMMNPAVLEAASATGRAVVTVQDHRIFCPGPGKTLPSGAACSTAMSGPACEGCLPDSGYRSQMLAVTTDRLESSRGAALVTLSSYMKLELDSVGLDGAVVIPPWVEVTIEEPNAGFGLLLAGRLVAHKAPCDGWGAWRQADCGMPLRVAGAGPLEGVLEGARRLGWLTADELALELRRCRALLFPSRWQEPFGILGVEALAQATPVIVARTGGVDEWADRGCLRVEPGDVGGMAAAIRTVAGDSELAVRLGRDGRDMVAQRFSRSMIGDRLRELYGHVEAGEGAASC